MRGKASITYTDSRGYVWDLMVDDIRRIKTASFHEYVWTKDVSERRFGERLRAWSKDAAQYQVTIIFDGPNREANLNAFHDALEYDVTNVSPGLLSWEEYSIQCYGVASKTYPAESGTFSATANDITFYCPTPWWTRIVGYSSYSRGANEPVDAYIRSGETAFSRNWLASESGGEAITPEFGKIYKIQTEGDYYNHLIAWNGSEYFDTTPDYIKSYELAYDYEYDYMGDYSAYTVLYNSNILGSKYILTIQGPATNPYLIIANDYEYEPDTHININTDVPQGAYLRIDSTDKTVIKYLPDGSVVNCFGARNVEAGYLWNTIPYGDNRLVWDGTFEFELYLVEERSEPKWLTD